MSLKHRLEAYRDLLAHYKAVFAHYWREREQLKTGLLNEHEAEFLPAALAVQEKPVSATAKLTGRVLMGLVVLLLFWSIVGQIDIIVTASGKVIPSERTKTIASVDVAVVRALYIQEGQFVREGEPLIDLDSSATDAEHDKAVGTLWEGKLQVARSKALIEAVDGGRIPRLAAVGGVPEEKWKEAEFHLLGQYRDFRAKLSRLEGEIRRYGTALPLAAERARDYQDLARNGDVSRHAWLEKEQARVDLEGQLNDARNQRQSLIDQTRKEAYDALVEASKLVVTNEQDARRAGEHSRFLKLVSPVSGTVQQLTTHTVGGVVPAAQPLMQIVPKENRVEVEAFLENKDIGFVEEGQSTKVKIEAYEYTKYGTIPGRVIHVSRDAIQDEKKGLIYSVRIALDQSSLLVGDKEVAITPGMSVSAEIRTGTRRVIEYVLSPLLQHQHEALNER